MVCRPLQVGVREGSRPGLGGRGLPGGEGLHAGGVQRLLRSAGSVAAARDCKHKNSC